MAKAKLSQLNRKEPTDEEFQEALSGWKRAMCQTWGRPFWPHRSRMEYRERRKRKELEVVKELVTELKFEAEEPSRGAYEFGIRRQLMATISVEETTQNLCTV